MSVSNLTNTKWVFNDNITILSDVTYGLSFTSNNTSYTSLRLKRYYDSDFDEYMSNIYYNNDNVYGAESTGGGEDSVWNNQAYRLISITGGTDATNPDLIAWLTENATLQPNAKTFDLSTLQLSAGTHEVKVKARATGYRDSNFSNSVSYVIPQGYKVDFILCSDTNGYAMCSFTFNGKKYGYYYENNQHKWYIADVEVQPSTDPIEWQGGIIDTYYHIEGTLYAPIGETTTIQVDVHNEDAWDDFGGNVSVSPHGNWNRNNRTVTITGDGWFEMGGID